MRRLLLKIADWAEQVSTRLGLFSAVATGGHAAATGHMTHAHFLSFVFSGLMAFVSDDRYSEAFRGLMNVTPKIIDNLRPKPKESPMSIVDTVITDIEVAAATIAKTAISNLPAPYGAVGVAVENLIATQSAANWIALVSAVVTAIETAEAKLPPGAIFPVIEPETAPQ